MCSSSPWSNAYFPAIDDGFVPSEKLRLLEIEANELFDAYRELYFEGGVSSVYLWDLDNGFAGSFLIKKSTFSFIFALIMKELLCFRGGRQSIRQRWKLGLHSCS